MLVISGGRKLSDNKRERDRCHTNAFHLCASAVNKQIKLVKLEINLKSWLQNITKLKWIISHQHFLMLDTSIPSMFVPVSTTRERAETSAPWLSWTKIVSVSTRENLVALKGNTVCPLGSKWIVWVAGKSSQSENPMLSYIIETWLRMGTNIDVTSELNIQ